MVTRPRAGSPFRPECSRHAAGGPAWPGHARAAVFALLLAGIALSLHGFGGGVRAGEGEATEEEKGEAEGREAPSAPKPTDGAGSESWAGKVLLVPVKGPIVPRLLGGNHETIKGIFARIQREKPKLVILEIDTYGGLVFVTDEQVRLIRAAVEDEIRVVAYVNNRAISAGAIVATACSEIYMAPGSRIGDVQPMGGQQSERDWEKSEADIRAMLRANAELNGYNPNLLASMVSRKFELYEVRFKDGARSFLFKDNYELLKKNIEEGIDARRIADARIIVAAGMLGHFTTQEAIDYGIAKGEAKTPREVLDALGVPAETPALTATLEDEEIVWRPGLDFSLPSVNLPPWQLLLLGFFLAVGFAGVIVEAQVPGFGVAGAFGVFGFGLFFAILFLEGNADLLGLTLALTGLVLLALEILVIPGFGVPGVLGAICLLAGLVLSIMPPLGEPGVQEQFYPLLGRALFTVMAAGTAALVGAYVLVSNASSIPLMRNLVHRKSLPTGRAALDAARASITTDPDYNPDPHARYLGRAGVTTTPLRPAGKVRLDDGTFLDVVSDGRLIETGARVAVAETTMNRVLVRPEAEVTGSGATATAPTTPNPSPSPSPTPPAST